ncbi:MAG: hypothetical protein IJ088_14790 [Clostridia bacterium]|nr:hypothetical protein [Clostridia bacterium]
MSDPVRTICYRQAREWDNRGDVIDFFQQGAKECDGAERDRYTTILLKLLAGEMICSDE